jgi:hypothetical protein
VPRVGIKFIKTQEEFMPASLSLLILIVIKDIIINGKMPNRNIKVKIGDKLNCFTLAKYTSENTI